MEDAAGAIEAHWDSNHTMVPLHTHVFPKPLFDGGPGLRLACSHVLSTLEQLSLPPSSIDSFAVLRRGGLWSCWGRTGGSDGQRSGESRDGRMEALKVRRKAQGWHVPVTFAECVRGHQGCDALRGHFQSLL